MSRTLQQFATILLALFGSVFSMIAIETGPSNVTILVGQDALFTCRVRDKGRTEVYWFRLSTGSRISSDWRVDPDTHPAAGEYRIEGDRHLGDISLKITQVQAEDAGDYYCGYSSRQEFITESATLTVLVPPDDVYPRCMPLDGNNLAVGQTANLMCLSHGGSPPAKLVWTRNGKELTNGHEYKNEYEIVLSRSDSNARYECHAKSPAITQPRSCTTHVTVNEPVVIMQPFNPKAEVNGSVTFLCNRQDWPAETRFRWYFRGEEVAPTRSSRFSIIDYNRSLRIDRVKETDGGAEVQCRVTVMPELEYSASVVLSVSLLTGETVGSQPPPRLFTNLPSIHLTSPVFNGNGSAVMTAASGMTASDENKQSRDATVMIVILGAGGGFLVVVIGVVVNHIVVKRNKQNKKDPMPKSDIRSIGSGISILTTKPSERSLTSTDSASTSTAKVTTYAMRKGTNSSGTDKSKKGNHYAELDANGVRLSEYQSLNSPPNTIYAEPIIAPTKLVPRPQHQNGFHDYALPDILPEPSPDDYVEPDPLPREKRTEEETNQEQTAGHEEEEHTPKRKSEDVYIEIIA